MQIEKYEIAGCICYLMQQFKYAHYLNRKVTGTKIDYL